MDLRIFGPSYPDFLERLKGQVKKGLVERVWYAFPEIRVVTNDPSVVAMIKEDFPGALISTDGTPIEVIVGNSMIKKGFSLATAESCTGGLISHMITNVPGSSRYFLLGAVVYSNEAKKRLLKVKPETLQKHGAVSKETVKEMLDGVLEVSGADCAIAVSGIAGPGGGTREKPVGTVYIGVKVHDIERITRHHFDAEREGNKMLSAYTALSTLLRLIGEV